MSGATRVVIFDGISQVPVFHRYAPYAAPAVFPDGLRVSGSRSMCGEVILQTRWYPADRSIPPVTYDRHAIRVRLDQAVVFARPCKRCHPGATP
jgi:hypothetical protein